MKKITAQYLYEITDSLYHPENHSDFMFQILLNYLKRLAESGSYKAYIGNAFNEVIMYKTVTANIERLQKLGFNVQKEQRLGGLNFEEVNYYCISWDKKGEN